MQTPAGNPQSPFKFPFGPGTSSWRESRFLFRPETGNLPVSYSAGNGKRVPGGGGPGIQVLASEPDSEPESLRAGRPSGAS
jgi:hypothetical protein